MDKSRNPRLNPLYGGKDRKRCNAFVRHRLKWNGSRDYCKNWPVNGGDRCRFHGGMSTGPRTEEGKARSLAAAKEGRQRWLERMKEAGEKIPCGRKSGKKWITPRMKARMEAAAMAAMPRLDPPPPPPRKKSGRPTNEERMARFFRA